MFFDISSRNIKNLHLYGSVYVDEFSIHRIRTDSLHNYYSFKSGFQFYKLPIRNSSFTFEYTHSNPITYQHRVPSLTFASNKYNLGHYLSDNSRELYFNFKLKPHYQFQLDLSYILATHYNDYEYLDVKITDKYPVHYKKSWQSESFSTILSYKFLYNSSIYIKYQFGFVKAYGNELNTNEYYLDLFGPKFYQGITHTVFTGLHFNF